MKKIIFDRRWEGGHGIGRFSTEITSRIKFHKYIVNNIKPTNPIDILITPWYLFLNNYVYFTPGFNAPYLFVKRSVITIHDLNHIDLDNNSSFLKKLYYRLVLKRACKKSLAIFTVSEFSKRRIIDWAGIDGVKVTVVGNGVSGNFKPDGRSFLPGYNYIFCVSNRKEHKNEKRLIEAFSLVNNRGDLKLVFSGKPTAEIIEFIKSLNLENDIVFTGFISDDELPAYYRGALMLVMPSIYEGFGLPVIEAMACGTPTIASNTTSLSEIAGDASLLVDPLNVHDISAAMHTLISDSNLREELKIKGLEHVKQYTWENTVHKIKTVLEILQ
ncbi:glycosyltransferase family 4 protein [Klebsiella grimontii]|uniref:glycosyltransferase family 4 protein n=1 Tax=Klebsiella grimontii TaxID=2058152 RepID=UPI0012B6D378|nr:glycosyltransferase family 1 protein [Klebsiella grimontii]MDU3812042.1 glycosyltransferase family 1 protein [Klebsiella grimontii]QLT08724.1 glycosyltransferase family 4 protein [Klebsiella grimontii]